MTKKRSPKERTQEIIQAALEVLDEKGLSGLTMEAVIERTILSKGGVYRFYGNKQELILDVWKYIVDFFQPVDKKEVVSWNLPLKETLIRLLFSIFYHEEGLRYMRIHIQLMPQLPLDNPMMKSLKEKLDNVLVQYIEIIKLIIKRDRLKTKPAFKKTIVSVIDIGQSFFDGLMINSLSGMPIDALERRMNGFISLVIQALIEDYKD